MDRMRGVKCTLPLPLVSVSPITYRRGCIMPTVSTRNPQCSTGLSKQQACSLDCSVASTRRLQQLRKREAQRQQRALLYRVHVPGRSFSSAHISSPADPRITWAVQQMRKGCQTQAGPLGMDAAESRHSDPAALSPPCPARRQPSMCTLSKRPAG